MLRPTRVALQGELYLSLTGLSPSSAGFPNTIQLNKAFLTPPYACRRTPALPLPQIHNACRLTCIRFRLRPFRSPLLRTSLSISLPPATEMFHFAGSPPLIHGCGTPPARFPHSDIHGSTDACSLPWLFAACYVLLRHLAPQASPACPSYLNLIYPLYLRLSIPYIRPTPHPSFTAPHSIQTFRAASLQRAILPSSLYEMKKLCHGADVACNTDDAKQSKNRGRIRSNRHNQRFSLERR